MTDLIALAERAERATGPDRELELAIWRALNPIHAKIADELGHVPLKWLHAYTSSLDAAMTLTEGLDGYDILADAAGEAWNRNSAFGVTAAETNAAFVKALPRYVTAACLRARAHHQDSTHEKG